MEDMNSVVFLSATRTPFGSFGGSLKDLSAVDLGTIASKSAIEKAGVAPSEIDQAVFGSVLFGAPDTAYLSRHIALRAGCPISTPALTVNRLCGSGFQAIVSGAQEILLGDAQLCLVGGTESMSQAPHVARDLRWGLGLGATPPLVDSLSEGLRDNFCDMTMGDTAEKLGAQYGIDREQSDEFALRSQLSAAKAAKSGLFKNEITPVPYYNKKSRSEELLTHDEHMRPSSTMEGLARLKPVFKKDGLVTAGNASGIGDGAASLLISSDSFAAKRGIRPLGRLISWGISGVDPSIMGIGPVPATHMALEKADMTLDEIDLIEVNEAFSAQTLAVAQELKIPLEKLNVEGGAIALSHPLGTSGARITTHLLHMLRHKGLRYGLGTACIGGGQGIAIIIESLP